MLSESGPVSTAGRLQSGNKEGTTNTLCQRSDGPEHFFSSRREREVPLGGMEMQSVKKKGGEERGEKSTDVERGGGLGWVRAIPSKLDVIYSEQGSFIDSSSVGDFEILVLI